jgi:hypothetical protein
MAGQLAQSAPFFPGPTADTHGQPNPSPTPSPAPALATTGDGPQNALPLMLVLIAGYCVAGWGLIVRERGRGV